MTKIKADKTGVNNVAQMDSHKRYLLASVTLALLLACSVAAAAQDITAGEMVAHDQCSGCHYTGKSQTPPFGFAPAFSKIARSRGMTQTAIQVYLRTQHEVMPNYVLSPKEIRDVAAYIDSLR